MTTQDRPRKPFPLLRSSPTSPLCHQGDPPTHPPPPWAPGASWGPSPPYPPRRPLSGGQEVLRPLGRARREPRQRGPNQALCGPPCRPMGPHSISRRQRGTPGDRAEGCLPARPPPSPHSCTPGPPYLEALWPPPLNNNRLSCKKGPR